MSMTLRARSLRASFPLLLVASLGACGLAEEAKDKLDGLGSAYAGSFETATRSKVEQAADGRTFVLRTVARREAHWYEAMSSMSHDLDVYCADGVPFSVNRMSPAHNPLANKPGEYTWHPAGTVFEQEITCSDPFSDQRVIAADTDHMAALEDLKTELVGDAGYDRDRHLYTAVSFDDRNRKYAAVTETIGSMVMGVNRRCRDAGVQVRRILVHSKPTPDPAGDVYLNRSMAFVGIDAVCADGLAADSRR